MTLITALIDRYFAAKSYSKVYVPSLRGTLSMFARWLEQNTGTTAAGELRSAHVSSWVRWTHTRRARYSGLPLAQETRSNEMNRVLAFCRYFVRRGAMSKEVLGAFEGYRQPQLLPRPTPGHADVRKLLRAIPTSDPRCFMARTIAEVIYTSGIRTGEAAALDVGDIDLVAQTAKIFGKGEKERIVPLGRTACRFLEGYIQSVRPQLLSDPREQALWLNSQGTRLKGYSLRNVLHPLLPTINGRRMTCYTFRRACATELIRGGANMWLVKDLLGHQRVDTLSHYVQLTIRDLQRTHARCHPRDAESTTNASGKEETT